MTYFIPFYDWYTHLRIHWRLSTVLKTSNRSVWSNVFWYVKVCIFWKCTQHIIHWDKTQTLKSFPSDKINCTKNVLFFLSRGPTYHSFIVICDSYMSRSTRFAALKMCVGFYILDSVSFLLKFVFLFNKMHRLFDFKTS